MAWSSPQATQATHPAQLTHPAAAGEGPAQWAQRFDISTWGFLSAFIGGERVGGAAVAHETPGLDILEDRLDLAVLWDIRVVPAARQTQNVNVAACRFYAQQGCVLLSAHAGVYPELPDEIRLFWYKGLP